MKRRSIIPAILCAGALLLTGCSRDTDLAGRFPDYFRYSFGDGYRYSYEETEKTAVSGIQYDIFRLDYTDITGKQRSAHADITPYAKSDFKDEYASKEDYYYEEMQLLVDGEVDNVFADGFIEQILKPHFPTLTFTEKGSPQLGPDGADGFIIAGCINLVSVASDDELSSKLAKEMLQPDTGIQVCTLRPEDLVKDDRYYETFVISLTEDADAAMYQEWFEAALADYRKWGPQNYVFALKQRTEESSEFLFREVCMLGETVDPEARKALWQEKNQNDDYSTMIDMRQTMLESRRKQ